MGSCRTPLAVRFLYIVGSMLRFFMGLGLLLLSSCGLLKDSGTPLAKVKERTLTREELQKKGITAKDSLIPYVTRWVNEEVLVLEARSAGLHKEKDVAWLIRDAERKILLDAYMQRFQKSIQDPEEGELEIYFEQNKSQYVLTNTSWCFQARDFRSAQHAKDSTAWFLDSLREGSVQIPWTSELYLDSCSRLALPLIKLGEVGEPSQCGQVFRVHYLLNKRLPGSSLSFAEARNLVLRDVRALKRARALDSLLLEAKTRYPVHTWPEHLSNP